MLPDQEEPDTNTTTISFSGLQLSIFFCKPYREPLPNRRLQLTAFGARDRYFFEVILCRAPSSAAEAQDVGPPRVLPDSYHAADIGRNSQEGYHNAYSSHCPN